MPHIAEASHPPGGASGGGSSNGDSWAHHSGLLPGLGMEAVMWALLSSAPNDLLRRCSDQVPGWVDPAPVGGSAGVVVWVVWVC